jgi:hypothetical protein
MSVLLVVTKFYCLLIPEKASLKTLGRFSLGATPDETCRMVGILIQNNNRRGRPEYRYRYKYQVSLPVV